MREMKKCETSNFGVVPQSWKWFKLKEILTRQDEKANIHNALLSVYLDRGVIPYNASDGTRVHKPSEDLSDYQSVHKGNFVLNNQQAWRGSVGISQYDGIISPAYFVYQLDKICNCSYMNYILRDSCMVQQYEVASRGVGTIQRNLYEPWFLQSGIVLPSIDEQRIIAKFLDSKCAEIEALTADIQAEIDILEQYKKSVITEAVTKGLDPTVDMKDSGIEWIGKIPRHWNLIRGKYILRCLQKPVYEDDSVITCFRDGEVTLRSNRREDGFTISEKEIGYQGVDVGDLIVHGMDGFAGAIGISDSRGKASPVLNVLATSQNKRYIMYYLRGMAYTDVFVALATGIRVRSCDLRWNKLAELLYPIPPENEQDKIVEYIDTAISETDTIIQGKKEFLKHLANYKKSLIYEYVTGKKEVPVANTNAVITVDPQAILLGGIVRRIGKSQHGRTQLQKLLYLCNTHLGLNLNIQYYRYEHGPYDVHLSDYIRELVKNQWFNEKKQDKNRMLVSGKKWEEFEQNYPNPFGEKKQEIGKLFKQLKDLSTRQIERIATLYAAWNDFLLDGITPSDDQIIQDVVTNWTENKANFQYSTWQESLNQLKQYGLIPKGTGLHTLSKP